MSSLMQHTGRIDSRGVGLMGYLQKEGTYGEGIEFYTCSQCGRQHEVLYEFFRKPRGMMGCWVIFAYCGEEHVPDLSIPIRLATVPRGARQMTEEEASKYWHS